MIVERLLKWFRTFYSIILLKSGILSLLSVVLIVIFPDKYPFIIGALVLLLLGNSLILLPTKLADLSIWFVRFLQRMFALPNTFRDYFPIGILGVVFVISFEILAFLLGEVIIRRILMEEFRFDSYRMDAVFAITVIIYIAVYCASLYRDYRKGLIRMEGV